jgi:FKBP-type peptidyl-prolyl cis-trans isomerase
MKKISKNEAIAIVVALVLLTGFVVFGSLGLFSKSSTSLSLNNLNMNIADNGAQQAPQLIITDLVVGTGTEAVSGRHIVVNYKGTLMDGTEFDSSYSRGEPFPFDLGAGQVIAGWEQGFSGMKVGGKRKLIIPANLAYGDRAIGPIPANSTLIFEVELLSVE